MKTLALTPVLSLLLLAACGLPLVTEEQRIADTLEILASDTPGAFHGTLLSEETREFATFGDLLDDAMDSRVVYVGETHTNPIHHALQEGIVRAMWSRDPRLAIGLEMFFRPFQGALDDYVARRIDEDELLRRAEYIDRWGFPWRFYAPAIRFAREKGIPVVALNIPKEITRQVAREGLASLTPEQQAEIPELDLTSQEHREFVKQVFLGGHELPEERFENFYTAMCVWDDGMAESAVRFLVSPAGQGRRMVVLVGAGHVRQRFGIPNRVARRTGWPQLVVVPEEFPADAEGLPWEELVAGDAGDYLYLTPPPPRVARPSLRVRVHPPVDGQTGVRVVAVMPGGPASRGGVKNGDVILSLGRRTIRDAVDLRLGLDEVPLDRSVRLMLQRGETRIATAVVFSSKPRRMMRPRP